MAEYSYYLAKKLNSLGEAQVVIKICARMGYYLRAKSQIWIVPKRFSPKNGITIPTTPGPQQAELIEKKDILIKLTRHLEDAILAEEDKKAINSEWGEKIVKLFYNPPKTDAEQVAELPLKKYEIMEMYLTVSQFSKSREKHFRTLMNILHRYEKYCQLRMRSKKLYELDINTITPLILTDIQDFILNEHEICKQYPSIYAELPNRSRVALRSARKRTLITEHPDKVTYSDLPLGAIPKPRGKNYISDLFLRFQSFYIWAMNKYTTNNPFEDFKIEDSVYGDPVIVTIDDRNQLYAYDFSYDKYLERGRDLFVLQCFIGCRRSDYYRLKPSNILNGSIQYVAKKTCNERGETVNVPLHPTALEIINKYRDPQRESLMPFMPEQDYNDVIKKVFTIAGITYPVTVLHPITRLEVQVPINEIVSSHSARRCFVGNLCRKTSNLIVIGSMSGHDPNGRAIKRYYKVYEEQQREHIELLS